MRRTTWASGLLLPALLAVTPACDSDSTCQTLYPCAGVCVNLDVDHGNCGACGVTCTADQACVGGTCMATAQCTAPESACGDVCANLQTAHDHCGDCATACSTNGACVSGRCAEPLAVLQTSLMDRTVDRDAYVLTDVTYALTRLDMSTLATSRVIDHAILPDGRVILLMAQTEDVFELFLVPPGGGAPVKLSGTLVAGGDVQPGIVVSRDGTRVLYRADQDVDDRIDLYAVAVASPGASVKIDGDLPAGGRVSPVVAVSADGRRAAYVAEQDTLGLDEAYTVDLSAATPGPSVKLNPVASAPIWDLRLTPAGDRVVYRHNTVTLALEMVAVAAPGVEVPIDYAEATNGYVEGYQLSPDGSAVVFSGGNSFLRASLWRTPLPPTGPATRLVDGSNGADVRSRFAISADGRRVYYVAVAPSGLERLWRVDIAAPLAPVALSPNPVDIADQVTDFAVSPDQRSVVYRAGADGGEGGLTQPETQGPVPVAPFAPSLYAVDLTPATIPPPRLLATLSSGDGVSPGYRVTADGARVLFQADLDTPTFSDAYLVEVANPPGRRKVSPPLDQTADATDVSLVTLFPGR